MSRPVPDETPAQRRLRLDRVFGDVLPERTGDERDDGRVASGRDDELSRDVPPHHGGA